MLLENRVLAVGEQGGCWEVLAVLLENRVWAVGNAHN